MSKPNQYSRAPKIAVCGGSEANSATLKLAEEIGRLIASKGGIVVSGGLSGVMESAAKGARSAGGLNLGILPGEDSSAANEYVDIVLPTGLGHTRNMMIILAADAAIALPGKYGTLTEISFALLHGRPVISVGSWEVDEGVTVANSAEDAVQKAFDALNRN